MRPAQVRSDGARALHLLYNRSTTAAAKTRMNVDQYLAWAQEHPGRYELSDGEVIAMSPEGAGHAAVKYAVQAALLAGIRARGLPVARPIKEWRYLTWAAISTACTLGLLTLESRS